jgi:hypothetical protein
MLLILFGVQQNLFAQFGDGIVPFRDGNKWGWADVHTGKIVIEPVYDSVKCEEKYYDNCVHYISHNIYKDGKKGLIGYSKDSNKYIVKVPPLYDNYDKLDTVYHLFRTYLNDKQGIYQTGYGELIENEYKYISKLGADLLKLKSFDKNSFNEGLFSLTTKQMIVPTKYRIGFYFIWTESFGFEKDLYLERSLLQDEDSIYYFLAKDMKLNEVKVGIDFRFIAPLIRPPCESRVFECFYPYCYNLTNSKKNHYLEVVVSSQNKYAKNYIRYGKKKFLETNIRYNNIHIIGNRKGKKFGFKNKSEEILIAPEFYKIERLRTESISGLNSQLNILIGYKKNSRTLYVNSIKLIESKDDFTYCFVKIINIHRYIRIKNGELLGFISLENLNGYSSNFKWKLIEPKYKSLEYSCFYTLRTGVLFFEATDENGETFLVNDKGIEFRR